MNAVRNQQRSFLSRTPDAIGSEIESVSNHRVKRAERLTHQQSFGMLDKYTTDRYALLYPVPEIVGAFARVDSEVNTLKELAQSRKPGIIKQKNP